MGISEDFRREATCSRVSVFRDSLERNEMNIECSYLKSLEFRSGPFHATLPWVRIGILDILAEVMVAQK